VAEGNDEVVLGVDYGTVRVGLALGFTKGGLVVPIPVLPHPGSEDALVAGLAEVARARDATVVIIGNPLHMSGKASAGTHTVRRLREKLEQTLGRPVVLEDERLTSSDAHDQMKAMGLRWWQVPKGQIDAVAAMAIVKQYLARLDPRLLLEAEEEPPPDPELGKEGRSRRRDAQKRSKKRRADHDEEAD
jgi:putative holliday junction resolvase